MLIQTRAGTPRTAPMMGYRAPMPRGRTAPARTARRATRRSCRGRRRRERAHTRRTRMALSRVPQPQTVVARRTTRTAPGIGTGNVPVRAATSSSRAGHIPGLGLGPKPQPQSSPAPFGAQTSPSRCSSASRGSSRLPSDSPGTPRPPPPRPHRAARISSRPRRTHHRRPS